MKYSVGTIVKAVLAALVAFIGAATAGANGPDLSHLDLDQWLTALGTAIVAGGALLHRPSTDGPKTANDKAVASVTDVVAKAAEAHGQLVQQAVDSIQRVQDATGELTKLLPPPVQQVESQVVSGAEQVVAGIPVLGPLSQQVIRSVGF